MLRQTSDISIFLHEYYYILKLFKCHVSNIICVYLKYLCIGVTFKQKPLSKISSLDCAIYKHHHFQQNKS